MGEDVSLLDEGPYSLGLSRPSQITVSDISCLMARSSYRISSPDDVLVSEGSLALSFFVIAFPARLEATFACAAFCPRRRGQRMRLKRCYRQEKPRFSTNEAPLARTSRTLPASRHWRQPRGLPLRIMHRLRPCMEACMAADGRPPSRARAAAAEEERT